MTEVEAFDIDLQMLKVSSIQPLLRFPLAMGDKNRIQMKLASRNPPYIRLYTGHKNWTSDEEDLSTSVQS